MSNKEIVIQATVDIVSAYVTNRKLDIAELSDVIDSVFAKIISISSVDNSFNGAVNINDSITPDYMICLEDGKKLKMLKRYLKNNYNLTPEQYREKWGLPTTYPMVSPNYAKKRSRLAKEIGLGKTSVKTSIKTPSIKHSIVKDKNSTTDKFNKQPSFVVIKNAENISKQIMQ